MKVMTVMKKVLGPGALLALLALFGSSTGMAHHSFAMFEHENQIKMTGTVGRFQWTNPHVYIELEVAGDNGEKRVWTIEGASPGILSRIGWKFNIIKPGDVVTVIVGPLKSGEPGALLKQITLPDGTKMGNGGPAGEPNIE